MRMDGRTTSSEKLLTRRGWLSEWGGDGLVCMIVEGGVHGLGRSRGIPVHSCSQGSYYQGFPACLPVDTMHKSESCELLYFPVL
jgi:hypothetical protein